MNEFVVIFANGEIRSDAYCKGLIRKSASIICADGGYRHAKRLGVEADVVIGDFDSLEEEIKEVPKISYPTDKDLTDTELAIEHALSKGAKEILLLGGVGSRIDHCLTNILLLSKYPGILRIQDQGYSLRATKEKTIIQGKTGDTISLIPLFETVEGLIGEGFKYPLSNLTLSAGSRGMSNALTQEEAWVDFERGTLLIAQCED
jgi:thiamine pyrophosphokinase